MSMSILVQTRRTSGSGFLDSMDIKYQTEFEEEEQISQNFKKGV